jgi:hypothetical protein
LRNKNLTILKQFKRLFHAMRIGVCLCGCTLAGCARNFPVAIRDEEIAAFSMLAANLSRAAVPAVICQNRGFCYIF